MSAGFTPGPWSFDGPPSSRIVWAGTDLRVCFLTSDGPNLANARLIAAAPELYEALEAGRCALHGKLLDRADAALAKASVDGRRMAETENTGSVPQGTTSAVAESETPTPSSAQPGDA